MVSFLTVGVEASTSPRDREVRMNLNIYRTSERDLREIYRTFKRYLKRFYRKLKIYFRKIYRILGSGRILPSHDLHGPSLPSC